jgi:hypothetical protein
MVGVAGACSCANFKCFEQRAVNHAAVCTLLQPIRHMYNAQPKHMDLNC